LQKSPSKSGEGALITRLRDAIGNKNRILTPDQKEELIGLAEEYLNKNGGVQGLVKAEMKTEINAEIKAENEKTDGKIQKMQILVSSNSQLSPQVHTLALLSDKNEDKRQI
jgi:hypothetical protein